MRKILTKIRQFFYLMPHDLSDDSYQEWVKGYGDARGIYPPGDKHIDEILNHRLPEGFEVLSYLTESHAWYLGDKE